MQTRTMNTAQLFDMQSFKRDLLGLSHKQKHFLTELATFIIYSKVVEDGDLVFDLGANYGEHTRHLSALVGRGQVHAVEPNPTLTPNLKNIARNVIVHEIAAGNGNRTGTLHVPRGLDGWASLDDRSGMLPDRIFDLYDVNIRSLDTVDSIRKCHPTFIKIDVEGHEAHALAGMLNIIRASNPVIVLENPDEESRRILAKCGYEVFDLFGGSDISHEGLVNFIAIHKTFPQPERLFLSYQDLGFILIEYMKIGDLA